jgi:predicted site-specific integrase-resolvase
MSVPQGERFITREEAAHILHVNFTTLWRWDKLGHLLSRKIGGRRVMYKYSDVLALLNGETKDESKDE